MPQLHYNAIEWLCVTEAPFNFLKILRLSELTFRRTRKRTINDHTFYRSQTKLEQGYCFYTCVSFCLQKGLCARGEYMVGGRGKSCLARGERHVWQKMPVSKRVVCILLECCPCIGKYVVSLAICMKNWYTGDVFFRCNITKPICEVEQCENGGTCREIATFRRECDCPFGYDTRSCGRSIGRWYKVRLQIENTVFCTNLSVFTNLIELQHYG